ncbi:YdcF family protein [Stieleria sp. JC731]|uniref:YdcF family protein n=1 Tax=Pirellulaceae TaxID=2691357 RepID=UPI001E5514F4|nr:YdcF family protein [Stieleria sp. JC731]MCC9603254.1 YdcF family protein [Stieleria sp. JC731]
MTETNTTAACSDENAAQRCCDWKGAALRGALVCGSLSAVIVLWTWLVGGRALAERAMTDLAMPTALLWLIMLFGITAARYCKQKAAARVCAFVFLFVFVFFNPMVAGPLYQSTEFVPDKDPVSSLEEPLDAVVLLGGFATRNDFGQAQLNNDGERLMTVAKLWYAGKTKTIICTGTAHVGQNHPSVLSRELLQSIGVPEEVIFEIPGENTSQEMESMESFLADPPRLWSAKVASSDLRLGLATSAYHIPRALRLAERRQLDFIPIPCGFNATESAWTPRELIPNAGAAKKIASVCKTYLAAMVGR